MLNEVETKSLEKSKINDGEEATYLAEENICHPEYVEHLSRVPYAQGFEASLYVQDLDTHIRYPKEFQQVLYLIVLRLFHYGCQQF